MEIKNQKHNINSYMLMLNNNTWKHLTEYKNIINWK